MDAGAGTAAAGCAAPCEASVVLSVSVPGMLGREAAGAPAVAAGVPALVVGAPRAGVWMKPTLMPALVRCCPMDQWVPEAPLIACMAPGCTVSFSLFNRRYRCRMCGWVFCSACCTHAVKVGGAGASEGGRGLVEGAGSGLGSPLTTLHVCHGCFYETQLVISTRQEGGEPRRKHRGELKLLQQALIVRILSFLSLPELLVVSHVSSDFYFMSRHNMIWFQYNMAHWARDAPPSPVNGATPAGGRAGGDAWASLVRFPTKSTSLDDTAVPSGEVAKRLISLHARYHYTQFLDFVRRQEMAHGEGLAAFAAGSRILLSSPVNLALLGPPGVGKTHCIRTFVGLEAAAAATGPTGGFTRYVRTVRLAGDLATEVTLHIYDLSGAPRFDALRRLICRYCHAIGLCYDPCRKITLVESADLMMDVEPELGPQPVVVCGLLPPRPPLSDPSAAAPPTGAARRPPVQVSVEDAVGITVRGHGSLQCEGDCPTAFFSQMIQSLLDRLALATMTRTASVVDLSNEGSTAGSPRSAASGSSPVAAGPHTRSKTHQLVAQQLLNLTMQPSVVDILLNPR